MSKTKPWTGLLYALVVVQALVITLLWKSETVSKPIAMRTASTAPKIAPAKVEAIAGTDHKRITLTAKAAERIDLKTSRVESKIVPRTLVLSGEVMDGPTASSAQNVQMASSRARSVYGFVSQRPEGAASGPLYVRVGGDVPKLPIDATATVLPLLRKDGTAGLPAIPADSPAGAGVENAKFFALTGTGHGLTPGQRVRVELPMPGSTSPRMVIPYAAVIYDPKGTSWIYTTSQPLTYVRHRVTIDFIDGDQAVLSEGPAVGTALVTTGAMELYGTEFFVGH